MRRPSCVSSSGRSRPAMHGLVPVGTTGEAATLSHAEHRAGRSPVRAGGGRPGSGHRRGGVQLYRPGDRAGPLRQGGRRGGRPGRHPLLQPAEPGGSLPPFRGHRRGGGLPGRRLQRPGAHRRRISNETLAGWRSCRASSGSRTPPATCRAPASQRLRLRSGLADAVGRRPSALGYMAHGGHGCIASPPMWPRSRSPPSTTACLARDWETALDWQDS